MRKGFRIKKAIVVFAGAILFTVSTAVPLSGCIMPCPVQAAASADDALTKVSQMIAALPEKDDITLEDEGLVEEVEKAYDSLTSAEKARVSNIARLTSARQKLDQLNGTAVPEEETKEDIPAVKSFSVDFTELRTQATVIIYYIYDADGDGVNDEPKISITPPGGSPYQVTNISTEYKFEGLETSVTWSSNQARFDIASASPGKWVFSASMPVTFDIGEYTGKQQSVKPGGTAAEEPEETGMEALLIPAAAAAFIVFLFAIAAFVGKKGKNDRKINVIQTSLHGREDTEAELQKYIKSQQEELERFGEGGREEEKVRRSVTVTQADIAKDDDIEEWGGDTEDFTASRKKEKNAHPEEADPLKSRKYL